MPNDMKPSTRVVQAKPILDIRDFITDRITTPPIEEPEDAMPVSETDLCTEIRRENRYHRREEATLRNSDEKSLGQENLPELFTL